GDERSSYHIVRDYWADQIPGGRLPAVTPEAAATGRGPAGTVAPPGPGAGGRVPGGATGPTGTPPPGLSRYSAAFEKVWYQALSTGVVPNSRPPVRTAAVSGPIPPASAAAGS